MNKSDAINALKKSHRSHEWDGQTIGNNNIDDFVMGAGAYPPADEISDAIQEAVSNRIASALSSAPGTPDDKWKAWCKGEIDVDFSDIQEIINDID